MLSQLERQNAGLRTAHWRVISRQEKGSYLTLVVKVDEHALKRLEELQLKPNIGLMRAFFTHTGKTTLG